jgi:nitroreductase
MPDSVLSTRMSEAECRRLVAAAVTAPSGENAQPWRFAVHPDRIEIRIDPDRDRSPYNAGLAAARIACGAAVETMLLTGTLDGKGLHARILPDSEDPMLIATIRRNEIPVQPDPLASLIGRRITNRRPYAADPPDIQAVQALRAAGALISTEPAAIDAVAASGALNERLMLSNRTLHGFFFAQLNWTEAEDRAAGTGFNPGSLELAPAAVTLLRMARHWPTAVWLRRLIGLPALIQASQKKIYRAAGAVGVIPYDDTPQSAVAAGRRLQRVWLTATAEGLAFQPLAGTMLLDAAIRRGEAFEPGQIRQIRVAASGLRAVFGLPADVPALPFRVGFAPPPTDRCRRLGLDAVIHPAP